MDTASTVSVFHSSRPGGVDEIMAIAATSPASVLHTLGGATKGQFRVSEGTTTSRTRSSGF